MKISISQDKWEEFLKQWNQPDWKHNLRYGQALHNFFDLHKIHNNILRDKINVLYNLDGEEASSVFWDMFEIR